MKKLNASWLFIVMLLAACMIPEENGQYNFNNPGVIYVGKPTELAFILTPPDRIPTDEALRRRLSEGLQGEMRKGSVKVGQRMGAALDSADLKVTPLTPNIQPVNGTVRWAWKIEATEPGEKYLTLTLSIYPSTGDNTFPLNSNPILRERILVSANLMQYISGWIITLNPMWAFASTVVGGLASLFAWGVAKRKRRFATQTLNVEEG